MKEDPILPIHSPALSADNKPEYPPTVGPMSPASLPQVQDKQPRARGIARLTVHIPSAFKKDVGKASPNEPKPPILRWNTLEFRIYYIIVAIAISLMVWVPVSLSQRE